MSFFINTLIRSFLAQQAVDFVQREVASQVERELKTRREAAEQSASIRDGKSGVADFAIVFSQHNEAVGLLDRFPDAAVTRGNGNAFYTVVLKGKSVVVALPSDDSRQRLELVTNAVIDIFRPQRVVTAGFAAGIAPGLALLSLYVPDVLINAADRRTIDLRQLQLAGPQSDEWGVGSQVQSSERRDQSGEEQSSEFRVKGEDTDKKNSPLPTPHSINANADFASLFRTGTIVTTRRSFHSAAQKQELRKMFAAQVAGRNAPVLADRSAFPVLDVCQKRGMPVLPMRIVTSLSHEEFSREAKSCSGPTHPARRFGNLLGNFVRRPGSVIDTIKQKQRHLEAADVLAERMIQLLFQ